MSIRRIPSSQASSRSKELRRQGYTVKRVTIPGRGTFLTKRKNAGLPRIPPLLLALGAGAAAWILFAPNKAFAVEAGKTYRYTALIRPSLPAGELPGLKSYMEGFGNRVLSLSPSEVTYEVDRSSSGMVERNKILANYAGSNLVLSNVS
jgi:hypothetical protein